ncbi:uncharacterized protein LOC131047760 [Cryptomeria japonica]|uniref:uncharacterized protein LOC131047760 n=1 Tax=Cryptomeria japonica TaxID=3369 RepID=UPI0025AC340E|nr:uncharacterized protein LOC131047760 [Cryptomeria japonica]
MENDKLCDQTEVEWEAILQQLPELPGICLDDFLLPLSTDGQPAGLLSLPSFDEDGEDGGGFIDINSFLGDSSEDKEIQLGVYVDSGMNGGQFLAWQAAVEKQEAANGKMGGFTRKRKR